MMLLCVLFELWYVNVIYSFWVVFCICVCDSFEYGIYCFRLVSVFLCYVSDGVEFSVIVLCDHGYVDESANHGVESGVFVLYGVV